MVVFPSLGDIARGLEPYLNPSLEFDLDQSLFNQLTTLILDAQPRLASPFLQLALHHVDTCHNEDLINLALHILFLFWRLCPTEFQQYYNTKGWYWLKDQVPTTPFTGLQATGDPVQVGAPSFLDIILPDASDKESEQSGEEEAREEEENPPVTAAGAATEVDATSTKMVAATPTEAVAETGGKDILMPAAELFPPEEEDEDQGPTVPPSHPLANTNRPATVIELPHLQPPPDISQLVSNVLNLREMAQIAASHAEDLQKMTKTKLETLSLVLQRVYSSEGDTGLSGYARNVRDLEEVLKFAKDIPLDTPMRFPERLHATMQQAGETEYRWLTNYQRSIYHNPPCVMSELSEDLENTSFYADKDVMEVKPPQQAQPAPAPTTGPSTFPGSLKTQAIPSNPAALSTLAGGNPTGDPSSSAPALALIPQNIQNQADSLYTLLAPHFHPLLRSTFDTGIFAEEYQQMSVAIESAIGATHPALDLFYQMNCLKSNIARIDSEIEALSFLHCASVMQVASLRNQYKSDSQLPDPPALLPAVSTPTPSPTKKAPKEIKETKEPKEKKPKLAKAEAPTPKAAAKGSSKAKAKETVPKTRAKAAWEASETKTRAKTQAAPATEATKGKGKQRATTKLKEVVEKKEIVKEPVKEPEVEKKKEVVKEPAEKEGEALSWGDEDIEMEETGVAGEDELIEEEEDIAEEEEETD
ncbi:hypothetical protein H1R20_g16041, partial [Candolleomyces eurysporus]